MAKGSYKVTFKSNFSFEKLSKNLDGILGAKNEEIIDILAQITKRNISDGKLRPLTPTTLEVRRRGLSTFSGHNSKPTTETKPLLYTGRLLNSIKPVKEGIEMMAYGVEHNEGFTTPEGRNVPSRTFIVGSKDLKRDEKKIKKIQDDLVGKMNKAMRK